MSDAPRPSTLLLVAALLLVVGIGNVWIGQSKSSHYAQSLLEALSHTKAHPHGKHSPDSLYVKRLRSREQYYNIVRSGGIIMLVGSVALVLIYVVRKRSCRSTTEDAHQVVDVR